MAPCSVGHAVWSNFKPDTPMNGDQLQFGVQLLEKVQVYELKTQISAHPSITRQGYQLVNTALGYSILHPREVLSLTWRD